MLKKISIMAQCILHVYLENGQVKERKTFNSESNTRCYMKEQQVKHYYLEINNRI